MGDIVDGGVGHLDEELVAHGAKETLNFPAAFGSAGPGVDKAHPQAGAGSQQLA
jgi:hypothetical protein